MIFHKLVYSQNSGKMDGNKNVRWNHLMLVLGNWSYAHIHSRPSHIHTVYVIQICGWISMVLNIAQVISSSKVCMSVIFYFQKIFLTLERDSHSLIYFWIDCSDEWGLLVIISISLNLSVDELKNLSMSFTTLN